MRLSIFKGFSFGLTSGIITTLGMMSGLHSGTGLKSAIIGGIISIAIADSFSDALGIHVSEESDNHKKGGEVWSATISTFLSKLTFSSTFIIPVLFFELDLALIISIIWGLALLGILSYYLAQMQNANPIKVIMEHLIIAIIVITITHFVGDWVHRVFT